MAPLGRWRTTQKRRSTRERRLRLTPPPPPSVYILCPSVLCYSFVSLATAAPIAGRPQWRGLVAVLARHRQQCASRTVDCSFVCPVRASLSVSRLGRRRRCLSPAAICEPLCCVSRLPHSWLLVVRCFGCLAPGLRLRCRSDEMAHVQQRRLCRCDRRGLFSVAARRRSRSTSLFVLRYLAGRGRPLLLAVGRPLDLSLPFMSTCCSRCVQLSGPRRRVACRCGCRVPSLIRSGALVAPRP
jgi:hypothetical protein